MTAPGDDGWVRIVHDAALADGGDGAVAELPPGPDAAEHVFPERAFVVRHRGVVRAFVNRCAHVPVELDWQPGRFFDADGAALICSLHGARYDPADGHCLSGSCAGRGGLEPLSAWRDDDGWWYVRRHAGPGRRDDR